MTHKWTAIAAGVALALTACGVRGDDAGKTVTPDGDVTTLNAEDESVAKLAVEVLAEHLNVPQATITVDTVRAVDWPDSSIGCPQPDQAYLQVITPGHKITLRVDGRFHTVHESGGKAFVCKRQKATVGATTPELEVVWARQAGVARRELARQLGIEESLIIIAGASGRTWSDTSLGCAQPGQEYDERRIDGYVIRLRHGSRNYTYHTDLDRVIACPAFSED
ncbi:MAG: hypothetical protein QNJ00_06220 [Woeseiaceae bacterium]|nr:hypothetical protein [Woeseiaceae bacterium]MDJ0939340.1 hypothetical protein [Woeseiaceae bacterium]